MGSDHVVNGSGPQTVRVAMWRRIGAMVGVRLVVSSVFDLYHPRAVLGVEKKLWEGAKTTVPSDGACHISSNAGTPSGLLWATRKRGPWSGSW